MAGVASALIVLVTILKLGPLFQELPKVLAILLLLCPTFCLHHLHFYRVNEVFSDVCVSGCTFVNCLCESEGNVQAAL